MDLRPLDPSEISLGVPLPEAVYDERGRVLLARGAVVLDRQSLKVLVARGHWLERSKPLEEKSREPPSRFLRRQRSSQTTSKPPFFRLTEMLLGSHDELCSLVVGNRSIEEIPHRLDALAGLLRRSVDRDPDALLGSLQLFERADYSAQHAVHGTVLAMLAGRRMDLLPSEFRALVVAGLSRDLGFVELQEKLDRQDGPLSPDQKLRVRQHPQESANLLVRAGVRDQLWLDIVTQHHERIDGSGYPEALVGGNIHPLSRLMAAADVLSAVSKPRSWRGAVRGTRAWSVLVGREAEGLDPGSGQELFQCLGLYPPGTVLLLENGETVVVTRPTEDPRSPEAWAVTDSRCRPLSVYQRRDLLVEGSQPHEVLTPDPSLLGRLNWEQLWSRKE